MARGRADKWAGLLISLVLVAGALWMASPADAYVYWTDGGSGGPGSIGRANPDGSNPAQVFIGDAGAPYGMAVDGQYVYWSEFRSSIWRAPLDGTGPPAQYIGGLSTPSGLAVDGQNIYWVNEGTDSIGRARLTDPGNPDSTFITVPAGNSIGRGLALDGGYIYWGNDNSNSTMLTIGRASLTDPTHPDTAFISGAGGGWGVAINAGYIYWASGNTIGRANLGDPAHPQPSFVTGAQGATAVAVDGQYVYWATGAGGCQSCTIARASLASPGSPDLTFIQHATLTYGMAVDSGAPVPFGTKVPAIIGSDQEGQTLTETPASWTNTPTTVDDQWLRCDSLGSNCTAIAGATGRTYTLSAAEVGATVRVQEVATNDWGPGAPALSVQTAVVSSAIPSNITPPSISGSAVHGETLTSAHGSWSNGPTGYADQWLRCNAAGSSCGAIPGAIGQSYTPTAADLHSTIEVQEVASNAYGNGGPATSPATSTVTEPVPPTAVTLPATGIAQTSAVLHARVNPGAGPTTAQFQIAPKRDLTGARRTSTQLVSGAGGAAAISATVAKLSPSTRYYYRVAASNITSGKVVSGTVVTVRTAAPPPRVDSTMTWNLPLSRGSVTILRFIVHNVPRGARTELTCRGGGCPFSKQTRATAKSEACKGKHCKGLGTVDVDLTREFSGRHLATAALVTVRVTEHGWIGKEFIFHMTRPDKPVIGCLAPGGTQLGNGC